MNDGGRRQAWRYLAVLLLVLVDLWSKHAVFSWLGPIEHELPQDPHRHLRYPLLGEWLSLMLSENRGAAFGRFGDWPWVLVLGRIAAVVGLSFLVRRTERHTWFVLASMVLVLAGALGNLCDNLWLGPRQEGHPFGLVRDFIDVWFHVPAWGWDWHFPTFNVADSCITVGAIGWIASGLFARTQRPAEEPESASAGSG